MSGPSRGGRSPATMNNACASRIGNSRAKSRIRQPDRINSLDLRAKVLRFGRYRANVGFDFYHLFNSSTGTAYNQVFDIGVVRHGVRALHSLALPRPTV